MTIFDQLENLRPKFLAGERIEAEHFRYLFNYPRLWQVAIVLMASVAIIPLICVTIFDYRVTQDALKSEILLRTSPLRRGGWLAFLGGCVCLSISALYELAEFAAAKIAGGAADDGRRQPLCIAEHG